jgi:hypothetical protein
MKTLKMLLGTTAAVAVLLVFVSPASARNLSISIQRFRATWTSAEFVGAFGTTRCALTLEGSMTARTHPKTIGLIIGRVTSSNAGTCSGGSATVLTETLPWTIQYGSFSGRLPLIDIIFWFIAGLSTRVRETGGITCLVRSTAAEPASGAVNVEGSGAATSMTLGGTIRTGAECFGATGELRGTSNSLASPEGPRITIRLI